MEHRMARAAFIDDVSAAYFRQHLARVDPLKLPVGREVNDAENRTAAGWFNP